jgi:hypothetical protein
MPKTVYQQVVAVVRALKGVDDNREAERLVETALDICQTLKFTTNVDKPGRVNLSEWSVDAVFRLIQVCTSIADSINYGKDKVKEHYAPNDD